MSIRSTFFFIPFRNCTYVRPGYSAGEQNLYPTASMPGGLRKRRKTVAREAVPLGTEEKPVPKTGGSVERFGWSVLLPSSGSGASSSLHMPPTSLRRVLVWEDTHEDRPEGEDHAKVVNAESPMKRTTTPRPISSVNPTT